MGQLQGLSFRHRFPDPESLQRLFLMHTGGEGKANAEVIAISMKMEGRLFGALAVADTTWSEVLVIANL